MSLVVVKIGGAAGVASAGLVEDLVGRRDLIVVHGGSGAANALSERLGHPPRFITSPSGHVSRFTDERTLEAFTMAMASVNSRLVIEMRRAGINAIGLSGLDGGLLVARRKRSVRAVENGKTVVLRGDFTGTIEDVNTGLLTLLLSNGYVPVVGVPAISRDGEAVNADADRAAARIAGAMKAEALVILTNVPGLLADVDDPASIIAAVERGQIDVAIERHARGRMRKKLLGAKEAAEAGVARIVIASASNVRPLAAALAGAGTVIS